jgi:hypothetical protein
MKNTESKLKQLKTEQLEIKAEVATLVSSILILVLLLVISAIQK